MNTNLKIGLLFSLISISLFAQRETTNWYFGDNAGLNFAQGFPIPLDDGELRTTEGCTTISDESGNLLFYTNGVTVWNKDHQIMPNGEDLKGHDSSSQSVVVIPKIDNPNIYYVFTADVAQSYFHEGTGNGFNYSIIDISANGGLGLVTLKNKNLLLNASEKLTAVSALDGSGFWVLTQSKTSFYAYKVDAGGVNENPVISNIGPNISHFNDTRGCMKISPNGKKVAVAHAFLNFELDGSLNLYDFNLSTGRLSNEIVVSTERVFYGVEFSPNSKKLYASARLIKEDNGIPTSANIQLFQYDLEAASIDRSEFLLHSYDEDISGDLSGTLQLGFDKKLYHAISSNFLSVINNPNLSRGSSNYREYNVGIGNGVARFGLPLYIQSHFEGVVDVENLCFNNATQFSLNSDYAIQSATWNFGDPGSGLDNTSNLLNPIHQFTEIGIFEVIVTVNYFDRESQTYIDFIEINELPTAIDAVTLTQCDIDENDDGVTVFNLNQVIPEMNLSDPNLAVTFYKTLLDLQNDENPLDNVGYINEFNNQVVYAKVFENVDCYSVTEVTLNVVSSSNLGLYSKTFICDREEEGTLALQIEDIKEQLRLDFPGSNITLYATEEDALLEENEEIEDIAIEGADSKVLYFRVEQANACTSIGRLETELVSMPEVSDFSTVFCANKMNVLDAGNGFETYLWSTGETKQKIEIQQEGSYWVEVSNGSDCKKRINVDAVLSRDIEIKEVVIKDFRSNNSVSIVLEDFEGDLQFSLDGGETFRSENTFKGVSPGIYNLVITRNDCNSVRKSILVGGFPNYFTPNGDGVNDTWQIKKPEYFLDAKINIYDRYGKFIKAMNAFESWDGTLNGVLVAPTDYWFSIQLDEKTVYGHFSLKI